jgi:hypothetical protein
MMKRMLMSREAWELENSVVEVGFMGQVSVGADHRPTL